MLESISFTQDWRCFKTGEEFIFRPDVNLLVGDQGCGKSSLLTAIRRGGIQDMSVSDPDKLKDSVVEVIATECQSYTFDFEGTTSEPEQSVVPRCSKSQVNGRVMVRQIWLSSKTSLR